MSEITPGQCRAARALIGLSQGDVAKASAVSEKTLADFEREARKPYARTLAAIQAALEAAGVIFIASNGDGPGVRLRKDTETGATQ